MIKGYYNQNLDENDLYDFLDTYSPTELYNIAINMDEKEGDSNGWFAMANVISSLVLADYDFNQGKRKLHLAFGELSELVTDIDNETQKKAFKKFLSGFLINEYTWYVEQLYKGKKNDHR